MYFRYGPFCSLLFCLCPALHNILQPASPMSISRTGVVHKFWYYQFIYKSTKSFLIRLFIQSFTLTFFYQTSIQYVEIKCQLEATEVFIADLIACSTCFGHHYAHHQELKSIIQWLLPVVFRAVVFQVAGLVWS